MVEIGGKFGGGRGQAIATRRRTRRGVRSGEGVSISTMNRV